MHRSIFLFLTLFAIHFAHRRFRKAKGGVTTGRGDKGTENDDPAYRAFLIIYIPDYNLDKSAKAGSSEPFVSLCLKTMTGASSAVKKVKIVVVRCGDSSTFSTRGANKGIEELVGSVEGAGNANLSLEIVTANTPAAGRLWRRVKRVAEIWRKRQEE